MPTVRSIRDRDVDAAPITMLTAYDAPTAAIVDAAGIDMVLVGDSVGNTSLGYDSTLPVTVDELASHTGAVVRAVEDAVVIADMPFLSYSVEEAESLRNAGRMLKEEGAHAVKLESGPHTVELTERMVELGIAVQAHLGLTPQRVNQLGLGRQATDQTAAEELVRLAKAHEAAGAFSLVLEHIPGNVAAAVTEALEIPTIGIGAGPHCNGQVLVIDDVIGLAEDTAPFSKQFGDVRAEMEQAIAGFRDAVVSGDYPASEHTHVEADLELD
jgi:3-methyl-2-oxobutanoate hydroxymethyltransferase